MQTVDGKADTGQGIDITCGQPITAALVDSESNNYDPVDGLYLIREGNPGCNAKLQPGFKDLMTWVFLVPPGTQPNSPAFTDTTDPVASAETAQIALP